MVAETSCVKEARMVREVGREGLWEWCAAWRQVLQWRWARSCEFRSRPDDRGTGGCDGICYLEWRLNRLARADIGAGKHCCHWRFGKPVLGWKGTAQAQEGSVLALNSGRGVNL